MIEVPGIVLTERQRPPSIEMLTLHPPGPDEVCVRMAASGICHTDLAALRDARTCPLLLGHEGAGVVETVGGNVTHLRPGDHVVINWQVRCGICRRCLAGQQDLCENVQGTYAPRVFWRGAPLPVMLNAGTFCPFVIVPAGGAVPIRHDMPLAKAALLGCAVATGVGAALYTARVQHGEGVVVIGAGGVGLNVVQGARLANASPIIAIDIDETRLRQAQMCGATHTLNSRAIDATVAVRDLTSGRGVEHVFEVVGRSELMLQGLEMLARGGALTLVGAAARDDVLPFHPRRFMSQQQTIQGCIYGNIRPALDLPMFADWYMDGRLQLDQLIIKTVGIEEVPSIFVDRQAAHVTRTMLIFEGVE